MNFRDISFLFLGISKVHTIMKMMDKPIMNQNIQDAFIDNSYDVSFFYLRFKRVTKFFYVVLNKTFYRFNDKYLYVIVVVIFDRF